MSEAVRNPISLKDRGDRSLEERFYVRFPGVMPLATRVAFRLPPRSRLRQALIAHYAQLGFAALNRRPSTRDFIASDADAEVITPPRLVGLGFDSVYRGRRARIDFQRRLDG